MRVSDQKVDVNFECELCRRKASCGVAEAVYNGTPICTDCDIEMEIVDCEIDYLEI